MNPTELLEKATPLLRELSNDKSLDAKLHNEAEHLLRLKTQYDKTGKLPNVSQLGSILGELKDLSPLLRHKLIDRTTNDVKEALKDQAKWTKNVLPDLQLIDSLNALSPDKQARNTADVKAINDKLHKQGLLKGTTLENVLAGK